MSWLRFIPSTLPEHPLGDLAHLLRRQRAPQVLAALALALVSAAVVLRSESRATTAEHRWGTLSAVVVALDDFPAGTDLGTTAVRVRRLPTATLAGDVMTERDWVELTRTGAAPVIDRNIAKGEPIRAGVLVGDGAPDAGAGTVVAFPEGTLAPQLEPGDRVRVVAGTSPYDTALDDTALDDTALEHVTGARRIGAVTGVVVGPPQAAATVERSDPTDRTPGWIAWVSVDPADADKVARIALSGSVALVLDRPG